MKPETFFEKFDQFADAPDAVAKMRELVLLWAVQGKLVVSEGGSASDLLAEITERNEGHAADRGAKNPESEKSKDKAPDPLPCPPNWMTVPLHRLTDWRYPISYGVLKPGEFDPNGVPLVKSQNVLNGSIGGDIDFKITPQLDEEYKRTRLKGGEILLNVVGSLGRCAVVPGSLAGANVSRAVAVITLDCGLSAEYIELQLRALLSVGVLADLRTGSAQPVLNLSIVRQLPINLPPLAEQKRIVAKVDELMALCDRLEAQQQERETRHAALARASLARFADAPTPANLPFLFHPSYAIPPADLRKSILDLAVYGKLATPAPEDGELPSIEEFREAAAFLANSLRLRSPKESLDEAEPPFDVPAHWRWTALADLGAAQTGTTPSKNDHEAFNGDIPFIKPADILPDGINYSNESLTRYGAESGSRLAPAGSLLMVCIGTIGKCNLIERECAFNQQINALSPVQWVDSQYLLVAVRAPYFQDAAWKKSSSTTIAILNKGKWLSIPVPIPPLAEQRRIVAKVEQLMALVDALEQQLAASRATAANLLTALVAELTSNRAARR